MDLPAYTLCVLRLSWTEKEFKGWYITTGAKNGRPRIEFLLQEPEGTSEAARTRWYYLDDVRLTPVRKHRRA